MILDWHLGLGDSIICNGLVRVLAERHKEEIVLPAWERNCKSVSAMFSDINVNVISVEHDRAIRGAVSIGQNNPDFGKGGTFDQEFYRLADVPFECRWSRFKIPEHPQLEPPTDPYILVHGMSSDGYLIPPGRIPTTFPRIYVEGRRDVPIVSWLKMIAHAEEIHCIESSFLQLVESVPSKGKLFWHAYARQPSAFQRRKDWKILI